MGLIADIVESFVASLSGIAGGFAWKGIKTAQDLPELVSLFSDKVNEFEQEHPQIATGLKVATLPGLAVFTAEALRDPKEFVAEVFKKWDGLIADAFGLLNVEVPDLRSTGPIPLEAQIAHKLAAGREASQLRVTAAMTIINFVVLTGNAISVAAEAASLGTVRSIAEAVQSWVWANGLGSFSPLVFQPQVQASINPYLVRYYNSRAKAQIPPVTDIIRFQLREVFLAGRREELVGDEARPIYDSLMEEWGFDKFHADSYWGAHWQLPSVGQLNEMLFRGVIDRETWERFVRFNDLEPTSIPRLAEIIYNPYTRVDVRRMARLGILSDQDVLQAYADLGFFADTVPDAQGRQRAVFKPNPDFSVDKAQALVVFTKVFNAVPELRQRFSKGHIGANEVLQGLKDTGIPELRAMAISETIVKAEGPVRTAPERDLTRGLIARAWKLRLISFPQGIFLLERIGWSAPEAELILRVTSEPDDPLAFIPTRLGVAVGTIPVPESEFEDEGLVTR